ncbi:MAG: ribosome recycling factor [Proteobacteria bacterium]|nr:ribosome recycling factor [Pseudomonadota bacterium]
MSEADLKTLKSDAARRMEGALDALHKEFGGLRTGRAAASLIEPVMVKAYGSEMPLPQLGTIGVPEPRMLTVQVWDKSLVGTVERAIRDAGLGLNPSSDGQMVRIPIPALNEERRREITRVAGKYAEQARVAVRNIRRDCMDKLKRMERDGTISEDLHRHWSEEIQALTDDHIKKVDAALAHKESDILQV